MMNAKSNLAALREDYTLASLNREDILKNPILQFEKWFQEAVNAHIEDPNAMALATSSKDGQPHARIVLLKGIENNQFVFFTNYNSHKGKEISENPKASLLFHWKELQRQVRIEGELQKISESESTTYFHSRPFESQIGAVASHQSEILNSREALENRFDTLKQKYEADGKVPKPAHWGGFSLKINKIEFWQGRASRLHDRFLFTALQNEKEWLIERLNP